jgi:hypothetical protein
MFPAHFIDAIKKNDALQFAYFFLHYKEIFKLFEQNKHEKQRMEIFIFVGDHFTNVLKPKSNVYYVFIEFFHSSQNSFEKFLSCCCCRPIQCNMVDASFASVGTITDHLCTHTLQILNKYA